MLDVKINGKVVTCLPRDISTLLAYNIQVPLVYKKKNKKNKKKKKKKKRASDLVDHIKVMVANFFRRSHHVDGN
jgi:hypothetical protein